MKRILLLLLVILGACTEGVVQDVQVQEDIQDTQVQDVKTVKAVYSEAVASLRDKGLSQLNYKYSFTSLVQDEFGHM